MMDKKDCLFALFVLKIVHIVPFRDFYKRNKNVII